MADEDVVVVVVVVVGDEGGCGLLALVGSGRAIPMGIVVIDLIFFCDVATLELCSLYHLLSMIRNR